MRRLACLILCLFFCSLMAAGSQEKPAEKPATTPTTPTAGARLEFLDEVSFYEQRFLRLADAIPAEKYAWRPSEGVRSIGEVYMHVVNANYGFARMLGTPPPAGFDPKAMMALAGDKAKATQALKDSFAHFRNAILGIKDSELEREIKTPRGQTTIRGAFFLISGHFGEHLGQSIAYARQVGIVPPWTEERQRQEAEKPKP
ncbi:MAG TPA: DinB family protein [Candidatus Limnocylindrales bacterium]|nr:DinB family protein [Candidatus Limnocylindrales bacterium]